MAMQWYVVHTFSGYEMKAKAALEERVKSLKMEPYFDQILVPTEQVIEVVNGKKRIMNRKFFPGYMLVKMELNNEAWHVVKNTPKVTGFIGGDKNPPAVPEEEVLRITNQESRNVLARQGGRGATSHAEERRGAGEAETAPDAPSPRLSVKRAPPRGIHDRKRAAT
jgi:transcription termination/antitermination factor NusG